MTPGHFPGNHFPTGHFPEDHFPDFGVAGTTYSLLTPGHFPSTHSPRGHWIDDHWQEYGVSSTVYPLLTPGHFPSTHSPRGHWIDDHWLNFGTGAIPPVVTPIVVAPTVGGGGIYIRHKEYVEPEYSQRALQDDEDFLQLLATVIPIITRY